MTNNQTFADILNQARKKSAYKVEGVILDVTEQITDRMGADGITKSELASKIDASAPYVTKLLQGGTNFTVETLVKLADALNCELQIKLVQRTCTQEWIDLIDKNIETKQEFDVWSQVHRQREGLTSFQTPVVPQHDCEYFLHQSR